VEKVGKDRREGIVASPTPRIKGIICFFEEWDADERK
jgi:hypothetical protein